MPTLSLSITIKKPLEETYNQFMNQDILPEWLGGFKRLEWLSGEKGKAGSKHKIYFEERGKEVVFIEEVLTIKKNEEFSCILDHEMMQSTFIVRFKAIDAKTSEVTSVTNVRAKKLIWKLMMPMLKGHMKKRQHEDYGRLKKVIEEHVD